MSHGGAAVEDGAYAAAQFPCRADSSAAAGEDLSASLSETLCCLQDMCDGYLMTKVFRNWTDGLDLVAANDICDADAASDLLVNNDLEVVGAGTEFVGVDGSSFTNKITVEPLAAEGRRSYYEGMQYARVTIPDAELYKVSRSLNPNDELTDTREIFIGLLDMLPTGTRVVDSANQQVKVVLTRTQYGTFAAYGEQNIDYDFLSFLNARAHRVLDQGALAKAQLDWLDVVWEDHVEWQKCWANNDEYYRVFGSGAWCDASAVSSGSCGSGAPEGGQQVCNAPYAFNSPAGCVGPNGGCRSFPQHYDGWESNYESGDGYAEFYASSTTAHFAEISFVWDDRLDAAVEGSPVDLKSVLVTPQEGSSAAVHWAQWLFSHINPCTNTPPGAVGEPLFGTFTQGHAPTAVGMNAQFLPLVNQECGPAPGWPAPAFDAVVAEPEGYQCSGSTCLLERDTPKYSKNGASLAHPFGADPAELVTTGFCPQVTIAEDNFGRLYVPLPGPSAGSEVEISFDLFLKDAEGKNATLKVDMVLVAEDFVTHCDEGAGSIDLAERVIPSITIGTESENPPRLAAFDSDSEDFSTGAETLQDGLIMLELALNETNDLDDNLEVFMEDVLVIQINPGSSLTADMAKAAPYVPTYSYDPNSRDAWLTIPDALKAACSNASYSQSFFGCVYKHVLADEEVTDPEWSYLVGNASATTAQDFMAAMLGSGTAAVAARQLGRDYEATLLGDSFASRKKIGLWINPGHVWGQTVHNSEYSLSRDVVIHVLFGVLSGVEGTTRRMLLQVDGDGRTMLQTPTIKFEVEAAELVEGVLEDVVAVEVKASLALSAEEACMAQEELLAVCAAKLEAAVAPHASAVHSVLCFSVLVDGADCSGSRRADAAPTASVRAVIVLERTAGAHIDMDAVVAAGAVLSLESAAAAPWTPADDTTPGPDPAVPTDAPASPEEASSGGSSMMVIAGAAGAAVGVAVLGVVAWKARRGCGSPEPLEEVVSTGVLGQDAGKDAVENILWNDGKQGI